MVKTPMSYYLGARDVLEILRYYLEKSRNLKEFKKHFEKVDRAIAERRIHQLRETLFLDL